MNAQDVAEIRRLWGLSHDDLFGEMFPQIPDGYWRTTPPGIPYEPPPDATFGAEGLDPREEFQGRVLEKVFRHLTPILEWLCDAFCENRSKFSGDSINMAAVLADALIASQLASQLPVPIPVASLAVYVVRNGIMDRLCKCKGDPW